MVTAPIAALTTAAEMEFWIAFTVSFLIVFFWPRRNRFVDFKYPPVRKQDEIAGYVEAKLQKIERAQRP